MHEIIQMIFIRAVTGEMRRNLWNSVGLQLSFEMKNKICQETGLHLVNLVKQSLKGQIYLECHN